LSPQSKGTQALKGRKQTQTLFMANGDAPFIALAPFQGFFLRLDIQRAMPFVYDLAHAIGVAGPFRA
jgi:hypothetical protein